METLYGFIESMPLNGIKFIFPTTRSVYGHAILL